MTNKKSAVGYRKPPESSRWRPGQSGNPKGRPKKTLDFAEDAISVFLEPLVTEPGKSGKRLNTYRAMFRSACNHALAGNDKALKAVIEFMLGVDAEKSETGISKLGDMAGVKEKLERKLARLPWRAPDKAAIESIEQISIPKTLPRQVQKDFDAKTEVELQRLLKLYRRI